MTKTTTHYTKDTFSTKCTCSNCFYTYEVEHIANQDTIILGLPHHGNQPFIQLLDKNLMTAGNTTKAVHLYACPKCLMVQLCNEEVHNEHISDM